MTLFSSPLETGSRLTSHFGQRWGILHAGTDYAPPEPGQTRRPVLAVADAVVRRVGRGNGRADASGVPYHSGLYVWLDHGNIGGDRMRTYYGHLDEYVVKPGESVKAGQLIGYMGGSGANGSNDFAIHLHFGVAQNHDRPTHAAASFGDPGWINANVWLKGKGITVGWTEPLDADIIVPAATKPQPTPSTPEAGQRESGHVRSEASIRAICIKAGHGTGKETTGLLIERYQSRQKAPFTLVHDRVWGPRTEEHYRWTVKLQSAMNRWKGGKITVHGDYGDATVARVYNLQARNSGVGGPYHGYAIDSIPGPVFCRMLGIPPHP